MMETFLIVLAALCFWELFKILIKSAILAEKSKTAEHYWRE
jgi:hypothetical protein